MDSSDGVTRIGDVERTAAQDALGEHLRAGRLDPHEYSERMEAVALARTPADLTPHFADLPAPGPFAASPVDLGKRPSTSTASDGADDEGLSGRRPLGGHVGALLVGAAPFIALIVAFSTGFWWAFFAVPLAGMVVWGDPKAHRYWRHGGCGYPAGYGRNRYRH